MGEYIYCSDGRPLANERREITLARREIVRCMDCKYAYEIEEDYLDVRHVGYYDCHGQLTTGWDYYDDEPKVNPVKPDGFCAWGERK